MQTRVMDFCDSLPGGADAGVSASSCDTTLFASAMLVKLQAHSPAALKADHHFSPGDPTFEKPVQFVLI